MSEEETNLLQSKDLVVKFKEVYSSGINNFNSKYERQVDYINIFNFI